MADTIKIGNLEIDNLKVGTLSVDALYIGDVKIYPSTPTPTVFDVDLNNQWVESTKKLDGYRVYMSNSNHNVDNGYASMKFKFKGMPDFKLWINSYAESNYDYTVAWNMDVDYPTNNPSNGSTGVKANTNGKQYNPTNITAFTEVDYSNDGGEHFVVVTYSKDSSVNANDDRGYVAVKLTLLSTTWVVSSTEFIKKDDKYYQRINEVGTYEGGITALTGNYKEGNELPVTYKQGTADDFMVVGSGKYYKNYIYVTPKGQEINTGDYIQGDYIGEVTPSMTVTYTDNSEKTFYGLTSIEQNTDSNIANAKEVIIYDSVTSIGDETFYACKNLTDITVNSTTPPALGGKAIPFEILTLYVPASSVDTYKSANGWSEYADKIYPIGAQIPAMKVTYVDNTEKTFYNLTSIKQYTDKNKSNAKTVEIYDSVISIGNDAFRDCSELTSVIISNSVTSIGGWAFSDCTSLTGITIPDSVTNIGQTAFANCSSLTSITLPNTITNISFYMFGGCTSLTSITIPANVTDIDEYSFQNCSSLTGITIPSGVTSIGDRAFRDCSSLDSVTIENSASKLGYEYDAFAGISSSAKLYVPSNLLSDYQSDSSWTDAFKGGIYEIPS